jgi:hypothetical protein
MKARDITLAIIKNEKTATEDQLPSDTGEDAASSNSHNQKLSDLKLLKDFRSLSS